MKKIILTIFIIGSAGIMEQAPAYAVTLPPTSPLWASTPSIAFSNKEIAIFWKASSSSIGLGGYYIYRCIGTNCTLPAQPTFNDNNPLSTSYADATLSGATTYRYGIVSYDTAGNMSPQSPIITATTTGVVSNIQPVITLVSPSTGLGNAGQSFGFSMRQSSLSTGGLVLGNSLYSWTWDYGDGTTSSGGSQVVHTYANPGTYTVRLTVFDTDTGDQASSEYIIKAIPTPISGLVLRLRFNGDLNDYSGNQLQTYGAGGSPVPAFGSGEGGHGMYFDGSTGGAYMGVGDNALLDGLSALTISLYAMKNAATASGLIFVKQGQYSISLAAQGVTATLTNTQGQTVTLSSSTVTNADTIWHHYAVTYDGATATLYFDGAVAAVQSFSGTIATNAAANLILGKTPSGSAFNGSLDWVRLYNQSLDLAAIQYLYNGTQYGDVSLDGSVNIYDALLTAQYGVGLISLSPAQQLQADVGFTSIMSYNSLLIAQKTVNLILKFPEDVNEE